MVPTPGPDDARPLTPNERAVLDDIADRLAADPHGHADEIDGTASSWHWPVLPRMSDGAHTGTLMPMLLLITVVAALLPSLSGSAIVLIVCVLVLRYMRTSRRNRP
jgi:hypothetical protein